MRLRSGFVSIIGRPNAGKSTLLNALIGEKVAIVTAKPQTTQTRIHGVLEVAARKGKHPAAQIVFVDTPGVHKPGSALDKRMMREVHAALEGRDAVLLMVDATRRLELPELHAGEEEKMGQRGNKAESEDTFVFELIRKLECPVFLLINKIDLVERQKLLPLIRQLSSLHSFAEVFPISARKKDGLDLLLDKLVAVLPRGREIFSQGSVHGSARAISGCRTHPRENSDRNRRRGSVCFSRGGGALRRAKTAAQRKEAEARCQTTAHADLRRHLL